MSTEDRCAPIRDLLERLDGQPKARPTLCGGALVPITRDSWRDWERKFDVDFVPMQEIPHGAFQARVACSSEVLAKRGVSGALVHEALCARCAGIEKRVAKILAEVAAQTEQPR